MNRSSGEGQQGSSVNLSALSNVNSCQEPGLVNGEVTFGMKRRKHISNERQRRLHVNTLLESLQELLPDPSPRKDRYTLLMDVIDYLRSLEDKAQDLASHKAMAMTHPAQATNVVKPSKVDPLAKPSHPACVLQNLNVQAFRSLKPTIDMEEIIITFTSLQTKGIFSQILTILSVNQIDIINATFSITPDDQLLHFIHAQVPKDLNLQRDDDVKALLSSLSQSSK